MKIKVLFFASARERVNMPEAVVEIPKGASIARLLEAPEFSALKAHLPSLRFARNEEFAATGAILSDGDVVAVLPPVSGG